MPLDPRAVGSTLPPRTSSWTSKDAILYALGVGAGTEDLQFTTENTRDVPQAVLPTFPVVIGLPTNIFRNVGSFDWSKAVHGRQVVRLYRPLPVEGSAEVNERVVELQDKGAGRNGVIVSAATIVDAGTGELLAETELSLVIRGGGGFGGAPGAATERPVRPDRNPDDVRTYDVPADQALIYRLSGDRNPLHSDPGYAARAGFPKPILHGLCTYGYAARAVLSAICHDDVARFRGLSARFSAPVFPGERLAVHIWRTESGAVMEVTAGDDGRVVLDEGVFELAPVAESVL